MRIIAKMKVFFLPFFISLLLMSAGISTAGVEQEEEREKLLEQQRLLADRVERLKREQDFLLFQKTMYATDSKYLILNITAKTGQLKYKNRVLKDLRFFSVSGDTGRLKQGSITLTNKIEAARDRNALVFGRSLVLFGKRVPAGLRPGIPRLPLPKKDFMAVFYALENGAMAYIIP